MQVRRLRISTDGQRNSFDQEFSLLSMKLEYTSQRKENMNESIEVIPYVSRHKLACWIADCILFCDGYASKMCDRMNSWIP